MGALTALAARVRPSSRKVLATMGMFTGVTGIGMLCSLVRTKLMAVLVGPAGVGLLLLYNSVSDLVATGSRMNMDQTALREIARADTGETVRVAYTVTRWSWWLGLTGMVLMCALSPVISYFTFDTTDRWPYFCATSVVPLCLAVSTGYQAVLQGRGYYARIARISMVVALGGIALSVPLIWWLRIDAVLPLIMLYPMLAAGASLVWRLHLPTPEGVTYGQVFKDGLGFVRLGALLTAGLAMTQLCNWLFALFLNNYATTAAVGVYQAGYTVVNTYMGVIFTGMWVQYFPQLSAVVHSPRRVRTLVSHRIFTSVWILVPLIGGIIMCAPLIVHVLYAETFMSMVPYVVTGIAALGLRAASWCLALAILARGDGHAYIVSESASAVIGLLLNTVGYACFGFLGLGAAYMLWYALYLCITYGIYTRRYGYALHPRALTLVATLTVVAAVTATLRLWLGWWIPLAVGAVVGLTVYKLRK